MKRRFFAPLALIAIIFFPYFIFANQTGADIYKTKCAGCHGVDGKNKAFSVSNPLIDLSPLDMREKLKFYTINSSTRTAKGSSEIMGKQATKLTKKEHDLILQYIISNFSNQTAK